MLEGETMKTVMKRYEQVLKDLDYIQRKAEEAAKKTQTIRDKRGFWHVNRIASDSRRSLRKLFYDVDRIDAFISLYGKQD